jgi:hypothetical protein
MLHSTQNQTAATAVADFEAARQTMLRAAHVSARIAPDILVNESVSTAAALDGIAAMAWAEGVP